MSETLLKLSWKMGPHFPQAVRQYFWIDKIIEAYMGHGLDFVHFDLMVEAGRKIGKHVAKARIEEGQCCR